MTSKNISAEPMDVDLSGNSTSYMDISYDDESYVSEWTPVPIKQEIDLPSQTQILDNSNDSHPVRKRKIRPRSPTHNLDLIKSNPPIHGLDTIKHPIQGGVKVYHIVKKNEGNTTSSLKHIIISFIAVALVSILALKIMNVNCSSELDPYSLSEKLHRRVYGQYMAVTNIINTIKDEESRTKILFFYGGTGVGKSYTISLMLENSWNYTNVYHYTMPSFLSTFTTDLMLGLTMCDTIYFVVDDLIPADLVNVRNHIKDVVQKSNELNKKITIILVFNCDNTDKDYMRKCDKAFYKEVTDDFSNIKALKQFVKFEELTEQHLKKCIDDELGEGYLDEDKLKQILKNFNVSLDGCKGVHKKIKILTNL